jgi:UDP-3-O-[3-hydroxymyristoyl] glucosamine N-acyltransferase
MEGRTKMRRRCVIERFEPTAVVGLHVKLGRNNYIGHLAVIEGEVTLGNNDPIESAFSESMD